MSRLADISVAMQEWIVGALSGSQELADALGVDPQEVGFRLWDSTPPADAALPYVDIRVVEPRDVNTVPMVEVMATAEATVKVVGQVEGYEPIRPAAVAIHRALQGKTNVPLNGGGTMLSCHRQRVISYPEQTNGVEYRHLGGQYVISAQ